MELFRQQREHVGLFGQFLVRARRGFSLLDLKRFAASRGFEAAGYGDLTLDELVAMAPVVAPMRVFGFGHFVVVRGPVRSVDNPPDMVEWATRIAARYVPDGRADEYGRRNGVPGELLCRLRMERIRGERDIAL